MRRLSSSSFRPQPRPLSSQSPSFSSSFPSLLPLNKNTRLSLSSPSYRPTSLPLHASAARLFSSTPRYSKAQGLGILSSIKTGGLLMMLSMRDPSFVPEDFIKGVKQAYVTVNHLFARGDMESLKEILSPLQYETLLQVKEKYDEKHYSIDISIDAIIETNIVDARVDPDNSTTVNVEFIVKETYRVLNDKGEEMETFGKEGYRQHNWEFRKFAGKDEWVVNAFL